LTYYTAWAIDEKRPSARLAVSMAKVYASDAGHKASNTASSRMTASA
jgi:alkylation response protein AidB-like acyl-CoA dehydrogenase